MGRCTRGTRSTRRGCESEVERVDEDGDPIAFRARFDRDLDGSDVRVVGWRDGKLVDFVLPAIGEAAIAGPG